MSCGSQLTIKQSVFSCVEQNEDGAKARNMRLRPEGQFIIEKGQTFLGNDPLYWLCCEVEHYSFTRQYMTIQKKDKR
jgi:hypothetical protein